MAITLTLTDEQTETLGYALILAERHLRGEATEAERRGYGDLADFRRDVARKVHALSWVLDAAPAAPLATWSDHDRNVPADEQDEGGAL